MTAPTMEEERSHMTEKILNLTLEIICLLTGESFPHLKSGDHVTITVPPHDSLKPNRPNVEKIVEITKKMMELLTGEGEEDLITIKVKEEAYEGDGQQSTEEAAIMWAFAEDDGTTRIMEEDTTRIPTPISTGHAMVEKPSKDGLALSPGCKMEETMSSTIDGGLHSADRLWNPSDHEQRYLVRDGAGTQRNYLSLGCEDIFTSNLWVPVHPKSQRVKVKKLHSCSECGETFPQKSKLIVHYRSHTGEKPYSCPECGKGFAVKSYLSRHQMLHTGEKPFACTECEKCFTRRFDLVIHQRCHTGERPYSCSECNKCFSDKTGLTKHKRLHTGEKPHCCPECGKSFSRRSQLNEHQINHTRGKHVTY